MEHESLNDGETAISNNAWTNADIDAAYIKVDKFSRWSDVLKCVHEQGKDQKKFEMQRVLGIYI